MAQERKPRVGVTGPDHGGWPAWILTKMAVWRAGGHAIRITPRRPRAITEIDALIVGGGADIDPSLYGEKVLSHLGADIKKERKRAPQAPLFDFLVLVSLWLFRVLFSSRQHESNDKARDALELSLIRQSLEKRRPILGICRGMQLLNVALGGTLYQDILDFYEETPHLRTILPRKKIEIEPGSRLHRLFGRTMLRVNSLHHQSVKALGAGLHITAREPIGIIQAIEYVPEHIPENMPETFAIGVQWHPEFLPHDPLQRSLFSELVKQARDSVKQTRELAKQARKESVNTEREPAASRSARAEL